MKFIKRDKTKGSLTNDIREASGIVSNNSSGNSSTTLESHRIWGQLFDGTNDVTGDMQNVGSITATRSTPGFWNTSMMSPSRNMSSRMPAQAIRYTPT